MKVIEVKIIAAASYFAFVSRRVEDIAEAFDVDTRTIRRWTTHDLWDKTLNTIGYEGITTFEHHPTRDVERDTSGVYQNAKEAYLDAADRGEPSYRLARLAAEVSGGETRKVRDWAKRYKWRKTK